jgi:hypothetical protein
VACISMALAAFTNCKEQGAGSDSGSNALESQVRAAELEVENMKKELEEYRAQGGESAVDSEGVDMVGTRAELDVLQTEYEILKDELQEFKSAHPMPR